MPDYTQTTGAERRAHGDLFLPRSCTGEQQVRNVRACDEQDCRNRAQKQNEHGTKVPDERFMSYRQLREYTERLRATGFDVSPQLVSLERKLSFPFVTIVMTLLAMAATGPGLFWAAALLAGLCMGSSQSAARALVGLLALIPGWLYLEFVVHRGQGLYDEYVLNLFRLHIDEYRNLPAPREHACHSASIDRILEHWSFGLRQNRLPAIPGFG